MQQASVSSARLAELLDDASVIQHSPNAVPLQRARGQITFSHVGFSYNLEQTVLKDITFTVFPGMTIGLVGHTGSGKTTIANLLLQFYDVSRGCILFDGIDIREIRLQDLRRQIALVTQEPILFASSIQDNIEYARPAATA